MDQTVDEYKARIEETARQAEDRRYYLQRRYRELWPGQETALDLEYDACQKLVRERKARWLTGRGGPGIELTMS